MFGLRAWRRPRSTGGYIDDVEVESRLRNGEFDRAEAPQRLTTPIKPGSLFLDAVVKIIRFARAHPDESFWRRIRQTNTGV